MDASKGKRVVYGVILVVVITVILASTLSYYTGNNLALNIFLVIVGLGAGSVLSYFMYLSFTTEQTLELHPDEEVILESEENVYITPRDDTGSVHTEVSIMNGKVYLTNIGILVEQPNTGVCILYIPHVDIQYFSKQKNALKVQFEDANGEFMQVDILLGKDVDQWLQRLADAVEAVHPPLE